MHMCSFLSYLLTNLFLSYMKKVVWPKPDQPDQFLRLCTIKFLEKYCNMTTVQHGQDALLVQVFDH